MASSQRSLSNKNRKARLYVRVAELLRQELAAAEPPHAQLHKRGGAQVGSRSAPPPAQHLSPPISLLD